MNQNFTSNLVVVLLIVQVGLSAGIIYRLNNIDLVSSTVQNPVDTGPDYDSVSVDDDPSIGPSNALITIVEFSDYQCPYCADSSKTIKSILEEYPQEIHYVLRDFPLEFHPHAAKAAEAANCAGDQGKYWEMHDLLFEKQNEITSSNFVDFGDELDIDQQVFSECLEENKYQDEVAKDIEDGRNYQVNGTPTFFINGKRIAGATDEMLRQEINTQLQALVMSN